VKVKLTLEFSSQFSAISIRAEEIWYFELSSLFLIALCFGTRLVNMVSQAPSWSSFYKNLNSNLEINLKMQTIADFNATNVSESTWISNLAKNPGLAILLVDGFGKLVLLHNVSYLQENIVCSELKVLGLCGFDKHADVYRVDPKSASLSTEFPVPAWRYWFPIKILQLLV
jgi:hypothetical protein